MNAFVLGSTVIGTAGVIAWRIKEGRAPVNLKKIIIPPIGMSTGFFMFLVPHTRIPIAWALLTFVLGALIFAWPLIFTSKLHKEPDGQIWMKRSPVFFLLLLAMAAIRFGLRDELEHFINFWQTGALAFLCAFGMVLHWRINMLLTYIKLTNEPVSIIE